MPKVEKLEDLRCWQSARKLVREIYDVSEQGKPAKDFEMKDQLRRAALSVMNNIAGGFAKFSDKEFIRYLDMSQSSALEVKSMPYATLDVGHLPGDKVKELMSLTEETGNSTLALIRYLRGKK